MTANLIAAARVHGLRNVRAIQDSSDGGGHESWISGWATLQRVDAHSLLGDDVRSGDLVHFYFCPPGDGANVADFRKQAQLIALDSIPPPGLPNDQASSSGSSTPLDTHYRHYRPPSKTVAFWDDESGLWLVVKEEEGEEVLLLDAWSAMVSDASSEVNWSKVCQILSRTVACLQALHDRHLSLVWTHASCFTVKNGEVYVGSLAKAVALQTITIEETVDGSSLFRKNLFVSSELSSRFLCQHLRYLAPESALSRKVFPMNDLYGWGVLAYELITGTLVDGNSFDDPDRNDFILLEGIHEHVTSEITPPIQHQPSLPRQLSDIIMLALSKDLDQRYHSFDTLSYDLHKLGQICCSDGDLSKFIPGHVDQISRFKFPSFVIERDAEFEKLDDVFRSVKSADVAFSTRVMNIWGVSGVGKTRMVEEWARRLEEREPERVVVARCKTDQLSSTALTSFKQVFQSLLDAILTRPREKPEEWRQRIKTTVGSQYNVLLSLLPHESRRLLQEEDAVVLAVFELDKFLAAFKYWSKRFLQLFATEERPLVLLIDDAQWMTKDEIALWKHILDSENPIENVLAISMTRTIDSNPLPLVSSLSTTSMPLEVKSLTEEGVHHFLNECFSNRLESASGAVYGLIFDQTHGGLLYLRTFLSELIKDEVVVFDIVKLEWRVDMGQLHGHLRKEEVDHFLDRLMNALPVEVREVLKVLACLPVKGFPVKHLAELLQLKEFDLTTRLDTANKAGVVTTYQGMVKFTHDRQQSAASRLISPAEGGELHQRVSFFLRQPEFVDNYLYDACEHALTARDLGAPQEDEVKLFILVMESAKKAALTTTFTLAIKWLRVSEGIMMDTGGVPHWMTHHRDVLFRYLTVAGEIARVCREYDWALGILHEMLDYCDTAVEKLQIVCSVIHLLYAGNRPYDACDRSFATFKELGYDLENPEKVDWWNPQSASEVEALRNELMSHDLLPEDNEFHLVLTLACSSGACVYFTRSPLMVNLFTMGLSVVKAAGRLSTACGYLIGSYSIANARTMTNMHVKHALYGLAKEVSQRMPLSQWTSHELYVCASVGWCFHPFHEFENVFPDTAEQIMRLGDADFCCYFFMVDLPLRALSKTPFSMDYLSQRYTQIEPFFNVSNRLLVTPTVQYLEDRLREKPYGSLMEGVFTKHGEMEANTQLGYHNGIFYMYELRLLMWYDAPLELQLEKAKAGMQWDDGMIGFPPAFELLFLRSIIFIRADVESPIISEAYTTFGRLQEWSISWTVRIKFLKALQQLHQDPLKSLPAVERTVDFLREEKEHEMCGLLNMYISNELQKVTQNNAVGEGHIRRAFAQYEAAHGYGYLEMLKRRYPEACPSLKEPPELPSSVLGLQMKSSRRVSQIAPPPKLPPPEVETKTETEGSSDSSIDSLTLLNTSLTLAQEADSDVLLCRLLRTLCQNVRCDFAAMALCEDGSSSSIRLLAAGPFKRINPYNVPLTDEAVGCVCPSSIMLHVYRTASAIHSAAKLKDFRPDPFYKGNDPRTLICLPIRNQGVVVGVILLSSKSLVTRGQSDSSKEILDVVGTLATFASVTYSHHQFSDRLTKMVEQRTRELRNALQTKAMFLSQCSHELRSPLGAIMGLATVLEASSGLTDVQREHLRTITSSSEDLLALISNILDHAKLESNSVTLEEVPMNLRDVVETALETIAPSAQAKGVEIVLDTPFDPDLPGLIGDPFRTKQVLLNLLSNAVKFTPPPSPIKPNQSVVVRWEWKRLDGMIAVTIDVSDTGVGIPSSKMDKLFKSFSQVDESITRSYGGSGLGLVISRDLAILLGGDCTAHSEFGKGSTFTFSFVCHPDPKWEAKERVAFPTQQAVLLCSPSRVWVDNLVKNLRLLNFEPVVAEDIPKQPFHLIIMDTTMVDDAVLERVQSLQPLARRIYTTRAVDLASDMGRLNLERDSILARPIKYESLWEAIRPVSTSPKPRKRKDKPAKRGFNKQMAKECPLRILIVDDAKVNVDVCCRLLELFGYTDTQSATDGLQAVEAADMTKFDLILLDLQMPVLDGYEAFERMKKSPLAGDPCCVSLSANADKKAIERCREAGFFDILTKPIRTDKLQEILFKVFHERLKEGLLRARVDEYGLGAVKGKRVAEADAEGSEAPRKRLRATENLQIE